MIRTTVDGVAYEVDEARLRAMIAAHRRTVAAWDPDREIDEAALDEAITAEARAFEAAEVETDRPALCGDCVGTGLLELVFYGRTIGHIPCHYCSGSGRVPPPCPHPEPLPWDPDPTCLACGEEQ